MCDGTPSCQAQDKTRNATVPCYILYTDVVPSSAGEVRPRGGTDKTIEEWLHNNVGNVGYGWAGDSFLVAGSGHLEKNS